MLGSIFEENGSQINRKWQSNNSKMAVNKCDFGSFYKQNGSLDLAVIIKSSKIKIISNISRENYKAKLSKIISKNY